ncbi:MAG: hypothetical protein V1244_05700, partial [Nitrospinaceae bacterium]|nr:hypothetical protein [Nitrospinaceae bacterium]
MDDVKLTFGLLIIAAKKFVASEVELGSRKILEWVQTRRKPTKTMSIKTKPFLFLICLFSQSLHSSCLTESCRKA